MKTLSTTDAENILHSIIEYVKTPSKKESRDKLNASITTLTEAISDQKIEDEKIAWTRVNSDSNGNPRYVCHYTNFAKPDERITYEQALKRAKKVGGGKYNNKSYGGGVVFQSYNIQDDEKRIKEMLESLDGVGSTKTSTDSVMAEIEKTKTISEKTLKLLLRRKNSGEKFDDSIIWDNEIELSADQSKKGLKWLKNLWKSPTGKVRSNSPFGYREEAIIADPKATMYLKGFYDAGNASHSFWVPLYEVGGDNTTMEYYVSGGKINIVG